MKFTLVLKFVVELFDFLMVSAENYTVSWRQGFLLGGVNNVS